MKQDSPQILIVEDEESVLRLIDKELRSVGYACQLARNAQEARALMERQVFALIIIRHQSARGIRSRIG